MINLEQLYRQVIMDNYKNPKNKGLILKPEYRNVHLKNPSCGDDMHVSLRVEDGNILDIRHDGHGCSICCSSASVMSELLKGKSINEANEIINDFYEMVKGNEIADEEIMDAFKADNKSAFSTLLKKANEDARFVLPNACTTKIVCTFNVRSLHNFFAHRCCNRAQWEIRAMADEMLKLVKEVAPTLFKYAGPPCVSGPCPEGKMSCGKMKEMREKFAFPAKTGE